MNSWNTSGQTITKAGKHPTQEVKQDIIQEKQRLQNKTGNSEQNDKEQAISEQNKTGKTTTMIHMCTVIYYKWVKC